MPMTYASIFDAYGWAELERDARSAGATSLIVADLPVDARPELRRVQLVAPTSTDERLRLAADATDGWLYLVTVTGTTGARAELAPTLAPLAARVRAITELPLYAGFGISTGAHARAAAELVGRHRRRLTRRRGRRAGPRRSSPRSSAELRAGVDEAAA